MMRHYAQLDQDERDALIEAKRYLADFEPRFKAGDCTPDALSYAINACDAVKMLGSEAEYNEYSVVKTRYVTEYNMLITATHIM